MTLEKRYIFILLALIIAIGVSFVKYNNLNLNCNTTAFTTFFTEYEEKTRHMSWHEMVEKEQDPFITEIFNDQKTLRINWGLYHICNLPSHFFYKILHLKGANLWFATKLLLTCMGIGVVLLVFLIADLFYGPLAGLISSILMAFSPHIWVLYNVSADPSQPYNLLFSLLTVYFFLLYVKRHKLYYILVSGVFMGTNFLFLHVGSFLIPIIIFLFCIYNSFAKKQFSYLFHFLLILLIAFLSAIALNYYHSYYLHLTFNPIITFIKNYASWGPTASHTKDGLMLLKWDRFIINTKNHIQGVFINGYTQDWHHGASLTYVPMVYNYLITFLFLIGCFISIRKRKREDVFFFIWFFSYFFIYMAVIFVRQKNILGEIPPIVILATRALPVSSVYLYNKFKKFSERKLIYSLSLVLIISSVATGSYRIFWYLPGKNFYSSYRAHYQIYKHFSQQGYTDKTKIILTSSDFVFDANMMFRLFTENVLRIHNLRQMGLIQTTEKNTDMYRNKFLEIEAVLQEDSDRIFYCFFYFNDHLWCNASDEFYHNIFLEIHPKAVPFIVKGLDDQAMWKIYKIDAPWSIIKKSEFTDKL